MRVAVGGASWQGLALCESKQFGCFSASPLRARSRSTQGKAHSDPGFSSCGTRTLARGFVCSWAEINEPDPFFSTPSFEGYSCPVTIYPMVTGSRWSKSLCLTTPEGKVLDKWTDEVQGKALLDEVYSRIEGEPILVFTHSWMDYQHPSNGLSCSIDSRGLNHLKGYKAAACFQHGNMSPDDLRSLETLSKMMGVAPEAIRDALAYERFYESSLQCFLRAAIRDRDNQSQVSLFAQNEDMAQHLRECLGRTAIINLSLAQDPYPRAKTDEVLAKRELKKHAQYLVLEQGMSPQDISKLLNVPVKTVYRWTKGLKRAA